MALQDGFGIKIPKMGQFTTSETANAYLLGLQGNQFFLVSESPALTASDHLKTITYLVDQSDSWVMLAITGETVREVLARICPVDLHAAKFPIGKVVRTLMAHLGVIIYQQGNNSFRLLAPSSSAGSFLQALEAAVLTVNTKRS